MTLLYIESALNNLKEAKRIGKFLMIPLDQSKRAMKVRRLVEQSIKCLEMEIALDEKTKKENT